MRVVVGGDDKSCCSLITQTINRHKNPSLPLRIISHEKNVENVGKVVWEEKPGLVIWDIDGQEKQALPMVQRIKMRQPQVKIILINSCLELTIVRTALHCGIEDYLVKPLSPKELTDSLMCLPFDYTKIHCGHDAVARAIRYMQKNYALPITLDDVARKSYVSSCHLSRLMKKKTGKTFIENLQDIRLKQAEWLLLNTNQTVRVIAKSVGYSSDSYFTYVFRNRKGVTPIAFRRARSSGLP